MSADPIRLVQSAGAATLSQIWRVVITFATYWFLRRLIPPAEMGVWDWAEKLFILLAQVRDLGVPAHLVRQRVRDYHGYLRIQLFWGGALCIALALAAPVLALAFADRDAHTVPVLRLLCLFLFLQGLGSVPLTYFEAEQRIARTIPAELVRNAAFAITALVLAWWGLGVWSIVVAYTFAGGLYSAVLWWWARFRSGGEPLLSGSGHETGERLLSAAWPLMVLSILELAVLNLDPLLLGFALPDAGAAARAALALYVLFFFSRMVADAVGRALYPALVQAHADPHASFELYRIATLLLMSLVVPSSFFFFFNAEAVAYVLGGDEWIPAGRYLTVAAFVPLVRPFTMFGREYLLVVRRDRLVNVYSLLNLLSLGGLGYVLVTRTELAELGMAIAGYFPLGMLALAYGLRTIDRREFDRLLAQLLVLYVGCAVVFSPLFLVPDHTPWLRLAVASVLGAVAVAGALWWHHDAYLEFWRGGKERVSS